MRSPSHHPSPAPEEAGRQTNLQSSTQPCVPREVNSGRGPSASFWPPALFDQPLWLARPSHHPFSESFAAVPGTAFKARAQQLESLPKEIL